MRGLGGTVASAVPAAAVPAVVPTAAVLTVVVPPAAGCWCCFSWVSGLLVGDILRMKIDLVPSPRNLTPPISKK